SILTSGGDYLRAAGEVKQLHESGGVIVVVSAMKGVTDKLIEASSSPSSSERIVEEVYESYSRALMEVSGTPRFNEELYREYTSLASALWAVRVLGEVSPRARDYIVSFGERFSSIVMAAALESLGLRAVSLTGREAGIVTDDRFGEANPIYRVSKGLSRKTLLPLLGDGIVPVVTGFIGGTLDGAVTLLGRGGSDFSATLLASYLGAGEVLIYTVTGAVMSGDPRKIPYARPVDRMNFSEAAEVARLGLRKFHPRTFEPLIGSGVRVRITRVGGGSETVIDGIGGPPPVKAVTVYEDLAMIVVEGKTLPGRIGALAKAAGLLAGRGVNIVSIVQPPSETSMVFVIESGQAEEALDALEDLRREGYASNVYKEGHVSSVSVVGEGVISPGMMSRVHEIALGEGAKVVVWSPASPSISVLVEPRLTWKVANLLHDEVILGG
ncbi:MAG: aspartate kinase, partial [Desulfurococcales archaeon]|nr:aspartate kinase [Desulfurococcales archaeon]